MNSFTPPFKVFLSASCLIFAMLTHWIFLAPCVYYGFSGLFGLLDGDKNG